MNSGGTHMILEDDDKHYYHLIYSEGWRLSAPIDSHGLQHLREEIDKDPQAHAIIKLRSSEYRTLDEITALLGAPNEALDFNRITSRL
jgi:hypothetical protein